MTAVRWRAERTAKKKPRSGAGLRIKGERRSFFGGRARRLVSITAQGIGMRDAHVAASVRAWSAMPFPRLVSRSGPRDVIGRRPRPRSVGEITAIGRRRSTIGLSAISLASRATVGSTGISSRRAIGWRRGVGWRRAVAWGRSAILCICPHDPTGGSQNAHGCDGDQSAFHRYLPLI
jgi:hypothetical protein